MGTTGAPKPSAKISTTAMPAATGRPTSGGTSSPPPHPSSTLFTAFPAASSITSISIIIITIAAMLSKFRTNSKSAATSAIFARRRKGRKRKRRWLRECNVVFAKRKWRRKERSPDKHLDSQHYKATLLVWEEILSSTFSPWL